MFAWITAIWLFCKCNSFRLTFSSNDLGWIYEIEFDSRYKYSKLLSSLNISSSILSILLWPKERLIRLFKLANKLLFFIFKQPILLELKFIERILFSPVKAFRSVKSIVLLVNVRFVKDSKKWKVSFLRFFIWLFSNFNTFKLISFI